MGMLIVLNAGCSYLQALSTPNPSPFSTEGFSESRGGRPEAARLLVVVTDGESHDGEELPAALRACEAGRVTRFGIAVSTFFGYDPGWGMGGKEERQPCSLPPC